MVINHGVLTPITRLVDASVEDWKLLYDVNVFSGVALVCQFGPVEPRYRPLTNDPPDPSCYSRTAENERMRRVDIFGGGYVSVFSLGGLWFIQGRHA